MRTIFALLVTLSIAFSSAVFANQSSNISNNEFDQQLIQLVDLKLHTPLVKEQIAKKLNVNSNELHDVRIKSAKVVKSANGQYTVTTEINWKQRFPLKCAKFSWTISNSMLFGGTNIVQLSEIGESFLQCQTQIMTNP